MLPFSNKGGRDGARRKASSRKGHPETEALIPQPFVGLGTGVVQGLKASPCLRLRGGSDGVEFVGMIAQELGQVAVKMALLHHALHDAQGLGRRHALAVGPVFGQCREHVRNRHDP